MVIVLGEAIFRHRVCAAGTELNDGLPVKMHQGDGLLGGRQRWRRRRAGPLLLAAPHPGSGENCSLTGAHPQLNTL